MGFVCVPVSSLGFNLKTYRFFCAALTSMVCWCGPAYAEWLPLTQNDEGSFFYEPNTQVQTEHISVWRLTDFAQPLTNLEGKEVRSEKTLASVDCKASKLANSQVTRYAEVHAQGEVMNHYETPLRFTRIAPEGVDALLLKKLC